MGNGVVLEQGTHNELLSNPEGAYAKLVQAQKLREQQQKDAAGGDSEEASTKGAEEVEDMEEIAAKEVPLGRSKTSRSLASELAEKRAEEKQEKKDDHSLWTVLKRMALLNREGWAMYGRGIIAASLTGAVYPCFGIVFGKHPIPPPFGSNFLTCLSARAINGFSATDDHVKRHSGDRNALYFFVIAIGSACTIGIQNFSFASAAALLTSKLRKLSFRSILRQDIEFFDKDEHSTGGLVSSLSDDPQKVNGLAGITLGAIVQAMSTLIVGVILGLSFAWKVGLVAMGQSFPPLSSFVLD
jgi:ATP-binding cassette, subfamily B (MDR/TAP), member 1